MCPLSSLHLFYGIEPQSEDARQGALFAGDLPVERPACVVPDGCVKRSQKKGSPVWFSGLDFLLTNHRILHIIRVDRGRHPSGAAGT